METKKDLLDYVELRSESVQEILSTPPHWLIRCGNSIIFITLLSILIMSYLIKYPEYVQASIIVTSKNPIERIVAKQDFKIEKLLTRNHQYVKKGDILVVFQSTSNYQDVLKLKKIVDQLNSGIISQFPIHETSQLKLGDIQSDYNSFAKAFQDEMLFSKLNPYAPDNIAASQSLLEAKSRLLTMKEQKNIENAKYNLSKKNYDRSQMLYDQGVIPKMELENEKIKFLQAEQNIKTINISISQVEESITTINKNKKGVEINTEKDKINYSSNTIQLLEQLRRSIKQWEQNYLVVASINGLVSFQQSWNDFQFGKAGATLLTILPDDHNHLVGRMLIESDNSGKVVPGQKVLIKLDNYKYQEFGFITGIVQSVSLSPDENGKYYVNITLPDGLKTSYKKNLTFNKELRGTAEIVTEDLRLIDRFFYQIRRLIENKN